jgi:hypothetical protein
LIELVGIGKSIISGFNPRILSKYLHELFNS